MHVTKMGTSNTATLSIATLRKMGFEVAFTASFMPAKPKRLVGKCICQSFPQMFFGATSQARLRMSNPHTTAPGTAETEKLKNQRSFHTNLTCRRKKANTNPWAPPQPSWEQHRPAEGRGLFLLGTFQPCTLHHPAGSQPGKPPALTHQNPETSDPPPSGSFHSECSPKPENASNGQFYPKVCVGQVGLTHCYYYSCVCVLFARENLNFEPSEFKLLACPCQLGKIHKSVLKHSDSLSRIIFVYIRK